MGDWLYFVRDSQNKNDMRRCLLYLSSKKEGQLSWILLQRVPIAHYDFDWRIKIKCPKRVFLYCARTSLECKNCCIVCSTVLHLSQQICSGLAMFWLHCSDVNTVTKQRNHFFFLPLMQSHYKSYMNNFIRNLLKVRSHSSSNLSQNFSHHPSSKSNFNCFAH